MSLEFIPPDGELLAQKRRVTVDPRATDSISGSRWSFWAAAAAALSVTSDL